MTDNEYLPLVVVRWNGELFHLEDYISNQLNFTPEERENFKKAWRQRAVKAELISTMREEFSRAPASCVLCGKEVLFKLGDIRRPHFAHLQGDAEFCHQLAEEDPRKLEAHYRWEKYFESMLVKHGYKTSLEQGILTPDGPSESVRPDLLVVNGDQQIGFEVQLSNISGEKLQAKLGGYGSLNLKVFYFTPDKNVFNRCKDMGIQCVLSEIESAPENSEDIFEVLDARGRKRKSERIPKMLFKVNRPKRASVKAVEMPVTELEECQALAQPIDIFMTVFQILIAFLIGVLIYQILKGIIRSLRGNR